MSNHFLNIHKFVLTRLWDNLSNETREIIAGDPDSESCKWFTEKVNRDATKLYEDGDYKYNSKETFQYPR